MNSLARQYITDIKYITNKQNDSYLNFEILTTETCNFKCKYCFEGKTEEHSFKVDSYFEDIVSLIDEILVDDSLRYKFSKIQIDFWGGEPTINLDFMIKIMEYYRDNERVIYHLYSNGFNYNKFMKYLEENKDWLIQKFNIQISYDGKAIHDRFRIAKSNELTSDVVMANAKIVNDMGYTFSLKSTLPLDGFQYLYEVWNEFKELNISGYKFQYAPTIDNHSLELDKEKYFKIFEEQILLILSAELKFYEKYEYNIFTWLSSFVRGRGCTAGSNMLIVDNSGDIFQCHGALYVINKDELKIANIRDKDCLYKLKESLIFYTKEFEKQDKCVGCVSTYCAICNTISFDKSKKTTNIEKWFDCHSQSDMCKYYQIFGKIHRAFMEV